MQSQRGNYFFTDDVGRKGSLKENFLEHLEYTLVQDKSTVTKEDTYRALAYAIRDKLIEKYFRTKNEYNKKDAKRVY